MANLGDVKVILSLDVAPFSEGMKTALRIGEAGSRQLEGLLSLKPGATAEFTVFDNEVSKLADTLKEQLAPAAKETETKLNEFADQLEANSGNAFKSLNQSIKQAKADVLQFGANTVTASDSTKTYGQVLRELVEEKKILARQTKQAGEQYSGFASALGIAGVNIRNIITDIRSLNSETMSTSEFAMAVAQIGVSALAAAPAIAQLNIQWKALGGTGMFLGGSVLPTVLAGIAAVATAMTVMVGHIVHLKDEFGRIGQVLSGQMSYWDALKANLRDVTFGLIDLTDNADNAARSLQQLLSLSVASGKQFQDLIDLQNYEAKFKEGGEFFNAGYSKEQVKELIDNYKALQNVKSDYDLKKERDDQFIKNKTDILYEQSKRKNTGSSGTYKQEKEELDDVAKKKEELIKLQGKYNDAVAKGYKGNAEDLKKMIDDLTKEINRLVNGSQGILGLDKLDPKTIKDDTDILGKNRVENMLSLEKLLSEKRIELIQNEYQRRLELAKKIYYEELRLINTRGGKYEGATDEQLKRAKSFAELQFKQQVAETDAAMWTNAINSATRVMQIMSKRPENIFGYMAMLIQMASVFAAIMNSAWAGPLGAIAGLFGAFASFDTGGHTGGSNPRRAAGIVHENEWVAPSWMLNSMPQTFSMLENIRKSRAISNSSSIPGYFNGGRVSYPSNYNGGGGDGMIIVEVHSEASEYFWAKNTSKGNKKLVKVRNKNTVK